MVRNKLNIPELRFAGFIDEWKQDKIINLADYVDYRGKTPTKTLNGILLVTAKNIKQGFIDYEISKEFISPLDFDEAMRRGKAKIGDVLITTEAPLGNVASIDNENIALAQRVIKYRGKDGVLNNNFLKNYFLTFHFQKKLEENATGGTVQGIKGSTLHKLHIKIAVNIEEQEKIGSLFQKIDQLIELQQKVLKTTQNYKKSMLQKMFPQKDEKVPQVRFSGFSGDWLNIQLKNLVSISNGITGDTSLSYGKYKLTRIETIADGNFNIERIGYINELPHIKYKLNSGDILYSNINSLAHLGKVALYELDNTDIYHGINLLRLVGKKDLIEPRYLYSLFNTVEQKKWVKAHASQAVNQASINQTILGNQFLKVPSLKEQQKIGLFFQKLDQQIEQHQKKLENYQNLKKAMLQRMFV